MALTFTGAASGCADPSIGEWELTRLNQRAFPLVYVDPDVGCHYSVDIVMNIDEQLDAEMITYYSGCGYNYVETIVGECDVIDNREYECEFLIPDGGGSSFFTLDCEMSADHEELECRSSDFDTYVFERQS